MKKILFFLLASLIFFVSLFGDINLKGFVSEVEGLRNLKFKTKVKVEYISKKDMENIIKDEIGRQFAKNRLTDYELALKAFSLIPKKSNLKALFESILSSQVAGLYDNRRRKLYILKDLDSFDELNVDLLFDSNFDFNFRDIFIIHELDHALTDQNFNIEKSFHLEQIENEDKQLASLSVIEGDATFIMLKYLIKKMGIEGFKMDDFASLLDNPSLIEPLIGESYPLYLRESLLFAYRDGLKFINFVTKGDTKKIDEIYKKSPRSTEEVVFAEKYVKRNDPPKDVKIFENELTKGDFSKKIWEGTWGYFGTKIVLLGWGIDEKSAQISSEGWGGDRYIVYFDKTNKISFLWKTIWDSEKDAKEFEETLLRVKNLIVKRENLYVFVEKKGEKL